MKKVLRTLAILAAVLALAIGGAVAWLVATFDAARLKQEIETVVLRETGRTLKIEGELALGFWPEVAVRLGRSTLSEPGSTKEFARIEQARVAVALWPLFHGRVEAQRLAFDAMLERGKTRLALRLATPLFFDLAQRRLALDGLDGRLEIAMPALPQPFPIPFVGKAAVDLARSTAQARLVLQPEGSRIQAQVDVARFAPLALAFDLDIDQIDLDRYLPAAGKDGRAAAAPADPPVDLDVLKGLDIEGALKIGRLKVAGLQAGEVSAKLLARHDRLQIAPLKAAFYGGRLGGTLSADARSDRIALQQMLLSDVSIAPLLKDLTGDDLLAGRGQVALDVSAQGATVGALKKSLAGTARLSLADGALKGIDIGRQLRELKSRFSGGQEGAPAGEVAPQTDFTELSASFRISGGVARNDDLSAKSPLLRLGGAGDIDIGNGRLDYLLKASLVATSTGQGGKDIDRVKSVTLPVRLTGPFEKPAWKIEFGELAESAAKAKLEEKKAEVKQQAEDKLKSELKEQLRGLFRK